MKHARMRFVRRALVLLLLSLGLLLRLSWSLAVTPRQISDARTYSRVALELAAGQGYRADDLPTAYYPIGYPAVLALVHRVFGAAPEVARVTNAVLGTITLAAIYVLARAFTQSRAAALASLLLFTFYPADIAYTSVTLSQSPFNALALAGCALCLGSFQRDRVRVLAAGAVLALAMLTRHQGAVLLVLILGAWALQRHRWRWRRDCALLSCAFVLAAAPWTIRNAVKLGAFVPISTNGGINLYIGNNPRATGRYRMSRAIWEPLTAAVPGPRHGGRNEILLDRKASQLAWTYAKAHPRAALALWPRKLSWLYAKDDGFLNWLSKLPDPSQVALLERVEHVSQPYYDVVIALAVLGVLLALASLLSRRRSVTSLIWFPAAVVVSFTALHMLTFGSAPYHQPMMPWITISAGYAATAPWRGRRAIMRVVRYLSA